MGLSETEKLLAIKDEAAAQSFLINKCGAVKTSLEMVIKFNLKPITAVERNNSLTKIT